MSYVPPPQQMYSPQGGPPPKSGVPVWVWIIVGLAASCVCCPVVAAIVFPVFAQAKVAARAADSLKMAKQLGSATLLYSGDWDDMCPPFHSSEEMAKRLDKYLPTTEEKAEARSFVWNTDLSAYSMTAVASPEKVWCVCTPNPDLRMNYFACFADGHAQKLKAAELFEVKEKSPAYLKGTR